MEFGVGVGILRRGKKRGVNVLSSRDVGKVGQTMSVSQSEAKR
jgi:hypothetical protein